MRRDLADIADCFAVATEFVSATPITSGHINDSYVLATRDGARGSRYLLQRLNTSVFKQPALVMANIQRVTKHMRSKLEAAGMRDIDRRVLTLIPTRDGRSHLARDDGSVWRLYQFIEGTRVTRSVETPEQAYCAGREFGRFQSMLSDLAPPRLNETIPSFHDTPNRVAALRRTAGADSCGRAAEAKPELEAVFSREALVDVLLAPHRAGAIPERAVHNDAKLSNVLFDAATGDALCVIDLDTVMPGLSLFDFGDMVRALTCRAAEDETDLTTVALDVSLFEGVTAGYLASAAGMLNATERGLLVEAGMLITLEQAIRFLTDHLLGDAYYKIARPRHNLERCRCQLELLASIERQAPALEEIARHA